MILLISLSVKSFLEFIKSPVKTIISGFLSLLFALIFFSLLISFLLLINKYDIFNILKFSNDYGKFSTKIFFSTILKPLGLIKKPSIIIKPTKKIITIKIFFNTITILNN